MADDFLYVNGLGSERPVCGSAPCWTGNGASPYLIASDTDYLDSSGNEDKKAEIGDFTFPDGNGAGTINNVYIDVRGEGDTAITVFIHDGTSWNSGDVLTMPATVGWHYADVGSFLDTWQKIADAKMYIRKGNNSDACTIYQARIHVVYTAAGGPTAKSVAGSLSATGALTRKLKAKRAVAGVL